MSLSYTVDVHCDRCGNWIHGITKGSKSKVASTALKVAKAAGWSRDVKSTFTDLCPDCLKAERKVVKK